MYDFTIKLADVPIRIHTIFDYTEEYFQNYLTDEMPEIEISIDKEDISRERYLDSLQGESFGNHALINEDDIYSRTAILRKIADELFYHNVLLFHGSVIALNGKAYVFTAPSGTGKTTHSWLWLKNFPECHIMNGDKPFLLFRDEKVFACGSPWRGKEGFGVNEILPIDGICLLERDKTNHIERVSFSDALPALITQSHKPGDPAALPKVLRLISKLSNIKLYRLGCNMEDEAAFVSYNALVKNEHKNL